MFKPDFTLRKQNMTKMIHFMYISIFALFQYSYSKRNGSIFFFFFVFALYLSVWFYSYFSLHPPKNNINFFKQRYYLLILIWFSQRFAYSCVLFVKATEISSRISRCSERRGVYINSNEIRCSEWAK